MSALVALLTLVLLGGVILLISAPLRAGRRAAVSESAADRDELDAAREAKYREIRDAELDYRTGKLSSADYAAIDGTLRGEAVAILDRLEALDGEEGMRDEPEAPTASSGSPGPDSQAPSDSKAPEADPDAPGAKRSSPAV
jgi:hypothetical protein